MRLSGINSFRTVVEGLTARGRPVKTRPSSRNVPRFLGTAPKAICGSYPLSALMEEGRGARRSIVRATAAFTVLALLPAAAFSLSTTAQAAQGVIHPLPSDAATGPLHGTAGLDAPTVDALLRAWESGLFASFGWDGTTATGSFVQFSFSSSTGVVSSVIARNGTDNLPILESIEVHPARGFSTPMVMGPQFTTAADSMTILAHDAPSGLFEFRTGFSPGAVAFHLVSSATIVTERTASASWPQSTVTFLVGDSRARLVVGSGTLNVTGMTILANLTANDQLVMRLVPGFSLERAQQSAVLDALGSGRLAAEYALVSSSNGGWIEDSSRYRRDLLAGPTTVAPGHAAVWLGSPRGLGGLVLLAFDPLTMPSDAAHRLVVSVNGTTVPESTDVLGAFYASPGGMDEPFYARLSAVATVLAVYLPTLHGALVEVSTVATDRSGIDWGTEVALIAALGVVSVAAAVMFRRRRA